MYTVKSVNNEPSKRCSDDFTFSLRMKDKIKRALERLRVAFRGHSDFGVATRILELFANLSSVLEGSLTESQSFYFRIWKNSKWESSRFID